MAKLTIALAALLLCFASGVAESDSTADKKTFRLDDSGQRPDATLEDVSWLVGSWDGTAFGQRFEQVWNPGSAGSMVGMFKLYSDDGVNFYELLLLLEVEGSLEIRVKHFTPEFVAWEEKEGYITFPLVGIEDDAIHFSGLSFYRTDEVTMEGYLAMKSESGVREEKLLYRRSQKH
ncbi:MAG: DUF6265 family protein [Woeseiaceae bacterium]|nr:DUF6265 family protein [Woeseiaceae bacterium]